MKIYKFRIYYEQINNFYRDIEIGSEQTFKELHKAIQKVVNFNSKEIASFNIYDNKWNKTSEITLIDMSYKKGIKKKNKNLYIMSQAKIGNFINSNSYKQRIIYIYDFINLWTFYIKLLEIVSPEPNAIYPRCVTSKGKFIQQEKPVLTDADIDIYSNNLEDYNYV
jgi:hypothetical protein